MELALTKEIAKEYVEAVECYENKIISKGRDVLADSYINLAFLYWSFAFDYFGFDIPNNIPDDYSIIGGKRYQNILELGLEKFPNNLELHFWEKYFEHIIYSKEFAKNDCLNLIEKYDDKESKVLYFFLYLFDKIKYKKQRDELIEIAEEIPTAKNLYIKSLIV